MGTKLLFYILICSLLICFGTLNAQSIFLNDQAISKQFKIELRKLSKSKDCISYSELQKQLVDKAISINCKSQKIKTKNKPTLYNQAKESIFIIGKLFFQKGKKKEYIYQASCFVIHEDGILVTNHHVFEDNKFDYKSIGIMNDKGQFYPVTKILASSNRDDIAIFEVDTKGQKLESLKLGEDASIGTDINVISHPDGLFYNYSSGYITRAFFVASENNSKRMSISAEFGVGSSGAPVMNSKGEVVGIVSTTYPIPNNKMIQMVIKEITPVSNLKKLIYN